MESVAGFNGIRTYAKLKNVLKKTFGENSDIVEAVDKLEQKHDSDGCKTTVQKEVAAAGASQHPEIVEAAETLLNHLKAQPDGEQHIQSAIGHHIAQADRGGHATVITKGD